MNADFESWLKEYAPACLENARWHEDEKRYTILSQAQFAWEVWNAATERAARIVEARKIGYAVDDYDLDTLAAAIRGMK